MIFIPPRPCQPLSHLNNYFVTITCPSNKIYEKCPAKKQSLNWYLRSLLGLLRNGSKESRSSNESLFTSGPASLRLSLAPFSVSDSSRTASLLFIPGWFLLPLWFISLFRGMGFSRKWARVWSFELWVARNTTFWWLPGNWIWRRWRFAGFAHAENMLDYLFPSYPDFR